MSTVGLKQVIFLGLGLISGSLARRIRLKQPELPIYAWDINPETIELAQTEGVVTESLENLSDDRLTQPGTLIILGTHGHQACRLLEELVSLHPFAPLWVMDLGSTKVPICQLANEIEATNLIFIGGHPLAGREVSGYANSQADLFVHKRFLVCPTNKSPQVVLVTTLNWLESLDLIPIQLPPHDHDRLMSLVSHFPQFYAIALGHLLYENEPEKALQFLGGGLDDQLRLLISPYAMWQDIYQDNKTNVTEVLDQFIAIMQRMRQDLLNDQLAPWFEHSHVVYKIYQQHRYKSHNS